VRTLASAIGLVLAVPVTTLIAALTVGSAKSLVPSPGGAPAGPSAGGRLVAADRQRSAEGKSGPPPTTPSTSTPPRTRAEARARLTVTPDG
jgi:hypothetical protein